jgi:hypothetical protein
MDVVIRASPRAYGATFETLRAAVRQAARQLPTHVGEGTT